MGEFKSYLAYGIFADTVAYHSRYRYRVETDEFLARVQETGEGRAFTLPANTTLYRAQLGHEGERWGSEVAPYPTHRMKPKHRAAKEGRVNPKGIPCLYLADNVDTAISEVRPWIDAYVSVGHFRTVRDLKIMDCAAQAKCVTNTSSSESVWGDIAKAFSEPVTDSDDKAEYAPTQILAEVFQQIKCDGIKYTSLLGKGGNSFALFELKDADLFRCALHMTKTLCYDFSDEIEHYHVAPH